MTVPVFVTRYHNESASPARSNPGELDADASESDALGAAVTVTLEAVADTATPWGSTAATAAVEVTAPVSTSAWRAV